MTVAEALRLAAQLTPISDTPRLDVELLLAWVLQKNRTWLYTWPESDLSDAHRQRFEAAFARRRRGEPLAHITGQREFWSLPLAVNNSTLIPRPDTERLVELSLLLTESSPSGAALDLGTGTGAIALAFASERPGWHVSAVDVSAVAVSLAEQNREALGLPNVKCFTSHWFDGVSPGTRFDIILSNPPYIADADPHLNEGDVRFEPRSALVAAQDGLADIEHILARARNFLSPGGWLLIEHGWTQGEAVRAIFRSCGYQSITTEQDLGGRDRVTLGCLSP